MNLYGNYVFIGPDGQHLFNGSEKKARWYLKTELAEIDLDNNAIRLKFIPQGEGRSGDLFYLAKKENKCVVCGIHKKLTKHHIVPVLYRKHMPVLIKNHDEHEIVLLCKKCHNKYEKEAGKLKQELADRFNIPIIGKGWVFDKNLCNVHRYSNTILKYKDKIPANRLAEMMQVIKDYFKKEDISKEDLIIASKINFNYKSIDFVSHGEYVVVNQVFLQHFVEEWRRHFVNTMTPKHMPTYWDISRSIYRDIHVL